VRRRAFPHDEEQYEPQPVHKVVIGKRNQDITSLQNINSPENAAAVLSTIQY
jgi:hypothetical protein